MAVAKNARTAKSVTSKGATSEVDSYIAALPAQARAALTKLRKTLNDLVPDATEAISYGAPAIKRHGHGVVAFAAAKDHCALYVMSPAVMQVHAADLEGYDCSKGTIRFPADKPLPVALLKKLVRARIAENDARWPH